MKELRIFSLLLFSLLFINMVGAVPPITSAFVGNQGLDIQANILDYYKINTSAKLHIYVFNISNGALLNNSYVSCAVELSDKTGTTILTGNPVPHYNHFEMTRNYSIITEVGIYSATIVCNTTNLGGYKTKFFEATTNGDPKPEGIIVLGFILIMLLIFGSITIYIIRAVGLIIEADFDILDVAYAWGLYFLILGVDLFSDIYLGSVEVSEWLNLFIVMLGFPLIIIPVLAFFLSLFRQKKIEKEHKAEW